MIDLHNHLLPGIDDGAPDLNTALALARVAVGDGITHMVCTPHIHPGRYDNTIATIDAALDSLRQVLQQHHIALHVSAAAEVRFDIEIMRAVQHQRLPYLGQWQGKQVLLLEFPHGQLPFGAEKLTQWLIAHDVVPMIAHPERNRALLQHPGRLKPLLQQGCLLQLTAGAVAGRFGPACQSLAHRLLEADVVTVLASDAHNLSHRPPLLSEGLEHAAAIVGRARARRLVEHNPWEMAHGHFPSAHPTPASEHSPCPT